MKKALVSLAGAFILPLAGLVLAGCDSLAPVEADDAGFIEDPYRMENRADIPFNRIWMKPGVEVRRDYQKLYVAPVNTTHMLEMSWWDRESPRVIGGEFHQDVEDLAVYTREQIQTAFREDENRQFEVVETPGEGVAVLEMALVEVIPSKSVLHALGWLPPVGTGALASALNKRTVAFEARIRDGGSNEVIATFKDRAKQPEGIVDVSRLTWYGPAKGIIKGWAQQFVKISNRAPGEVVKDPSPFTLKPW